jgi:molecular chaperone DnaK
MISETLSQAQAASQGASGAGGQASGSGGSSGDDVVDAEFEEIDPRDRKAS